MRQQKLIRVYSNDTRQLDSYLEDGWIIIQISATHCACLNESVCYVVIEK